MMPDPSQSPADLSLGEMAERDHRLAEAAAHDAEVERPAAAGRPDHPHPDIAAADEVRAGDDVRTYERQEAVADQQARAAEAMEDSQRRLFETARHLESTHDEVHRRSDEVRALAADATELRDQARELAEEARAIEAPDV
jgi:hypothetical protein